jgi:hypothetical protein
VNLKPMAIGAALIGVAAGIAAPLPRGPGPDPAPDVSAPVLYEHLMVVLVTKDGLAAVVFDSPARDGSAVDYSFRYESADGKKKSSGTGKLFERRKGGPNGNFDPAGLSIVAGPIAIKWSMGSPDRGRIYYGPEVVTVHLAHASGFRPGVGGLDGKTVQPELDLRRFMNK